MRRILLPVVVLIFSSPAFSQKIDSLRTDAEVEAFLNSLPEDYRNVHITPAGEGAEKNDLAPIKEFEAKAYEKADFDHNGYTDLLFNGYMYNSPRSFVVMSYGKDSFQVKNLSMSHYPDLFAAKMLILDRQPCIQAVLWEPRWDSIRQITYYNRKTDTLVCVFNEFMEKATPGKYAVHQINYCAWGGVPVFAGLEITIVGDSVFLHTGASPGRQLSRIDSIGFFAARMDTAQMGRINGILNYINFPRLDRYYAVSWTDDIEGGLIIYYDDDKKKEVHDYGMIGTYGLAALQRAFFELARTQQWERRAPDDGGVITCSY
jgi:hypothetical protein